MSVITILLMMLICGQYKEMMMQKIIDNIRCGIEDQIISKVVGWNEEGEQFHFVDYGFQVSIKCFGLNKYLPEKGTEPKTYIHYTNFYDGMSEFLDVIQDDLSKCFAIVPEYNGEYFSQLRIPIKKLQDLDIQDLVLIEKEEV